MFFRISKTLDQKAQLFGGFFVLVCDAEADSHFNWSISSAKSPTQIRTLSPKTEDDTREIKECILTLEGSFFFFFLTAQRWHPWTSYEIFSD